MYVKNKMTAKPYIISPDALIIDAVELMKEKNLRRLPVVRDGKIVGILTKEDLQKVSPTKATSLSIFEINYLLSKTTVEDAMTKETVTISPDSLLEEAAVIMRDNKIGILPVVEDNIIVGVITESDILDAFIDILGFKSEGSRITIESKDVPGALAEIAGIFKGTNSNITHIVAYKIGEKSFDVIRTDKTNTEEIEKQLIEHGYVIEHIMKNVK
ncbi:MAG: CBS and ACT domain-containing protein [Sedimentibacter sp.]